MFKETIITTDKLTGAFIRQYLKASISLATLLLLPACSDKPNVIQHADDYRSIGAHPVYVVSHEWHTGFVIPSTEIHNAIPALQERFGVSRNIEFGWGDKKFYQAEEITAGLAIRALFWPTETVVHAVAVPENVKGYFGNSEIVRLCLNDKEIDALVAFISNSFSISSSAEVEPLSKGIYGDSQFYKGAGSYHMLNTCNEWTAKGLKSIGMDIFPATKFTAESVMNYLRDKQLTRNVPSETGTDSKCPPDSETP
ncbi:MAG: TIGR02117 family protein [Candidatus Thiodiazotropha taylori]|nr:TIGR02117 family protein [Candidatus Thiodiazotropha taylori]MCG8071792.1 TIGR02117 family protein [Candidatus Thiodiazotropha taylori]MCG8083229.1 TIGR02117 family protein [Candidatus Thiodiazotropha taylori]MCW4325807.1 TIGR02117 family protein [Candidatus Thiodiazotropha taylori]